jgi:uncharacterized protein YraI
MQHKLSFALLMGFALLPVTGFAQITTVTTETVTTAPLTESGFINQDVELYSGPDYTYPEVALMPAQESMVIYGCVEGYSWCDVSSAGIRGWVPGDNLYLHPYEQSIIHYGPHLTVLPIVVFNRDTYWDHWYRSRPFYHNWYQSHPRPRVIRTAPQPIIIREQSRPVIHNNVIVNERIVRPVNHSVNRPVDRQEIHQENHAVVIDHAVVTHPTPAVVHQEIRHDQTVQHPQEHRNDHREGGEQHREHDDDHHDGDHDHH